MLSIPTIRARYRLQATRIQKLTTRVWALRERVDELNRENEKLKAEIKTILTSNKKTK